MHLSSLCLSSLNKGVGARFRIEQDLGWGAALVSTGGDGFHLDVNWFFKKLVDVNYPSRNKNNWLIGRSSK